ncbi:hypothetical protein PV08_00224 [Exophiala spinifera]|uniref:Developmental regulatory protein wetA n=1 Tax=Exophiala spinifera TaxID=91928 RepID=A0A0D2BM32_9EURO|nr:uncharacterized protein PV08_00224 [Exophiala spinifera]KIW19650.1 hypothetical protein PV08_00224 [Exophiala spinifera]
MSLADSADGILRPEDKTFMMLFGTPQNEPNSFDEFFNEEMYKLEMSDGEDGKQQHLGHLDDFVANEAIEEHQNTILAPTIPSIERGSSPQPWRQGVWCLRPRQQPSELVVEKIRRMETKRPSPYHQTMNLPNQFAQKAPVPTTSLDSTLESGTKRYAATPRSATIDTSNFTREATLSPSPMYAHLPVGSRDGHGDTSTWQQDFQNFHLRLPYDAPLHSTLSKQYSALKTREKNSARVAENHNMVLPSHLPESVRVESYSTAIDPFLLEPHEQQPNSYQFQGGSPRTNGILHEPLSMHSPSSGSDPPSSSSQNSHEARSHASNTSVDMYSQSIVSPATAADFVSHPPLPRLEPEETYPVLAAPTPQRIPHPILQQPAPAPLIGLGIQYPRSAQTSQLASYDFPTSSTMQEPVIHSPPARTMPVAGPSLSSYPPLPPPASYLFSQQSNFMTPSKQRRSLSRSPSPPISPTTVSPRRTTRRSPTRTVTDYTHSRRKSIHKSGPMRDHAVSQEPPLPSPRARSSSRPPRTPKRPKTPTSAVPTIGFVNFTPADSAKLMSDVAPSGSSKTRARREMEAREKRKKLSEAALKAVRVAGGDVAAFEKAIFT